MAFGILKKRPEVETAPDWVMSSQDWGAVLGASLGAFMAILDIQITNASLLEIQGSLGLDFMEGGWISTAYLIAEVVVIPLTGFLSKVFGMRRYLLVNSAVFVVASMLCGLAWNLESMIFFRVLQGLSGGVLIPMSFQTMLLFMPPERKATGLAIFGATATLAPTLGPSLGGWLTDTYGWRTCFFINIVPGLLMMGAIGYGMPLAKMSLARLKRMDYWGTATLTLGLGTLTYILEEGSKVEWFSDTRIRVCTLVMLAALPVFLSIQLLRKEPLLNLRLFANRNFGVSAVITLVTAVALYGGIYSLSIYLGQVQGYGAVQIGQVMMWVGIPQLLIMPLLPGLMRRIDARVLAFLGMGLFAWSNYLNSGLSGDYAGEQFRWSLMIRAIGQPLFMIPLSGMAMALVSPSEAGNASSIYNVMRNLGGSIGIALAGMFMIERQSKHFQQFVEHLSVDDILTAERLSQIQMGFMAAGSDAPSAKAQALTVVLGVTQREALIHAFSDIFFILTGILMVCILLLGALKKTDVLGNSDIH